MMSCTWRRGTAPLMASDGVKWSTSRPGRFAPGKKFLYPLNRRLFGPQSGSGHFGGKKNLLPLPGFESRIVQLTVLSTVPRSSGTYCNHCAIMFNIAPWLPSLELAHRGECPLPVKSAGTLRREWRPSVRYSLESATCFHIAGTLPFLPLYMFSVLYGLQSFNSHSLSPI